MGTEARPDEAGSVSRWVKATTLGWLLGFALVVILAMLWDLIGGGAQFMVGVGMGAGVGFVQARMGEHWIAQPKRWILVTTAGMGLPFLLWDLASAAGVGSFFSLPLCVVLGSLLVGALQSPLLRRRPGQPRWWIPANLVGWGVPAAVIALANSGLLAGPGAIVQVVVLFFGGAVLGAVTGKALHWMPQRSAH